jgi:hypothetical protein
MRPSLGGDADRLDRLRRLNASVASAPGPMPIRQLGAPEVLDVSLKIVTRNAATLFKIAVFIAAPVAIASATITAATAPEWFTSPVADPSEEELRDTDALALAGGQAVAAIVGWIGTALVTAACFRAVIEGYLGAGPEWRRSLRFGLERIWRTLWLLLLMTILLVLAFLALIVPGIWLAVAWALAIPVLLFEDRRGLKALGRSYQLVKGRWWRTLWALFLSFLVASLAGGFVVVVLSLPLLAVSPDSPGGVAITALANTVSSVIFLPFQAAVLTVVYFDLRGRREGLDLTAIGAQLGVPPSDQSPARAIQGGFVPPQPGPTYHPPGAPPGGWAAPGQTPPGAWAPQPPPPPGGSEPPPPPGQPPPTGEPPGSPPSDEPPNAAR